MQIIKKLVEAIDDELDSAKEYAEMYVEYKAKGDTQNATRFKEMSNDELKHAAYEHEIAVKKIAEISQIYVAPEHMQKIWDEEHKKYIERVVHIRQMLEV